MSSQSVQNACSLSLSSINDEVAPKSVPALPPRKKKVAAGESKKKVVVQADVGVVKSSPSTEFAPTELAKQTQFHNCTKTLDWQEF